VKTNPYSSLADHQFWNRTVAFQHRAGFDPIANPRFTLTAQDAIATMGSCFAQHLTKWLLANRLNFMCTDKGGPYTEEPMLFSANYGNTYTAVQALQLIQGALGLREFSASGWVDAEGLIRDPLRPSVPKGSFSSIDAMLHSRDQLFQAVREIVEGLDILVFTLGLTETWVRLEDGAALPSAPGVAAGEYVPSAYEFVNYSYDEVTDHLFKMIDLIRQLNPSARVLLTVSPVPLAATYENRHVAVSTMASKAILRAAADAAWRRYDFVEYFPSFELFYTPGIGHAYYERDQRHVRPAGVNRAMQLFQRHFFAPQPEVTVTRSIDPKQLANSYFDVFCDEDLIA